MACLLEMEDDVLEAEAMKILVATDIHLGYLEKHQIRGEDSFVTFEEILQIAVKNDVDFILLGGDLFHDCKPSPYCIQKCSELIRTYCFGDKPVRIEFMSDQSVHFKHLKNPVVNYEDPNINVSIPIFSIHGNHDDPTGNKSISAIDLLATNGLINYFARCTDLKHVEILPIILGKGNNKLALYGLSHIHDQRLARLFRDGKVSVVRSNDEDCFNLLVLHQNRAGRGVNNFIPASFIPDFMDLVVWGHEHDCAILPEKQKNDVWISQPGSSVATSLSLGESIEKHVGLLYINGKQFQMKPIPLQTVRPFIFKSIILKDISSMQENFVYDYSKHAMEFVTKEIEAIIKQVEDEREAKKLKPILPLVRVVVLFNDHRQQFSTLRFNQKFNSRVANPEDIVVEKLVVAKVKNEYKGVNIDLPDLETETSTMNRVIDLISEEFEKQANKNSMKILSVTGLGEAVTRFIELNDADAFADLMEFQIKSAKQKIIEMDVEENGIDEAIANLKNNDDAEVAKIQKMFANSARRFQKVEETMSVDNDDDIDGTPSASVTAKPARGRGRGSRGPRGPRGSRAKK